MSSKRVITTELEGREEAFRVLAVAEAIGKPCLLIGVPGTAKTQTLMDYSKAYYGGDAMMAIDKTFILETDEGTKSAEVKGRIDIGSLVKENQYVINSPIVGAEYVLINEIDKASAGLRNSLLGVMNEKFLFNGENKVPCSWKVFCATANEIPEEELNSPFWDRFVFKANISRITKTQLVNYYTKQSGAGKSRQISIEIPTADEISNIVANMDIEKLKIVIDACHSKLSDRTLSYLPRLIAAVGVVYGKGINQAIVKTAELLCGYEVSKALGKKLEPAEISAIRSKIELLAGYRDVKSIITEVANIRKELERVKALPGVITESDYNDVAAEIRLVVNQNPVIIASKEQKDAMKAKAEAIPTN